MRDAEGSSPLGTPAGIAMEGDYSVCGVCKPLLQMAGRSTSVHRSSSTDWTGSVGCSRVGLINVPSERRPRAGRLWQAGGLPWPNTEGMRLMNARSRQGIDLGLSGLGSGLLFILTVVSAYVPTFMVWPHALSRPAALGLLAAGVVYVLVDMYGGRLVQRSAAVAYFAIQIPLGAAIIYMSHSVGWIGLIMLPLVAKSVRFLPRRQMLSVCALIVVAEAVVPGLHFGWEVMIQSGLGFLAGAVFTVVITQAVVRERQARVEVERLAAALGEANRQLEAASHYKSEFLANMSHELRTPLNAIIGFTRLVMRRSKDVLPTRQYENLEKILLSSEHLLGLINDILDLSKIEAGRMDLHPVEF